MEYKLFFLTLNLTKIPTDILLILTYEVGPKGTFMTGDEVELTISCVTE